VKIQELLIRDGQWEGRIDGKVGVYTSRRSQNLSRADTPKDRLIISAAVTLK
jgi:hypothetical protein